MKKTILALAAAATIAVATLSAPTTADAQRRGFGLGLGILGAVVVGTIIGNAIVNHPGYYTYDDYSEYAGPGCYWARRAYRDEDGNVRYSRPRRFCD